jgi:hypothetical protein
VHGLHGPCEPRVSLPAQQFAHEAGNLGRDRPGCQHGGGAVGERAHQGPGEEELQERFVREAEVIGPLADEERAAVRLKEGGRQRHVVGQVLGQDGADRPLQLLRCARRLARAPELFGQRLGQLDLLRVGEDLLLALVVGLRQPAPQVLLVEVGPADARPRLDGVERRQHHAQQQGTFHQLFQRVQAGDLAHRLVRRWAGPPDLRDQLPTCSSSKSCTVIRRRPADSPRARARACSEVVRSSPRWGSNGRATR